MNDNTINVLQQFSIDPQKKYLVWIQDKRRGHKCDTIVEYSDIMIRVQFIIFDRAKLLRKKSYIMVRVNQIR